jgi:hypothetical protein
MSALLQKFALVALMLLLPLQGLAAATAPVLCLGDNSHHSAKASVEHPPATDKGQHAAHEHGTSQHDHSNAPANSSGGEHAANLCCCHFAAVAPVTIETLPQADLPIYQSSLSFLATLHIPELPQRPPRS